MQCLQLILLNNLGILEHLLKRDIMVCKGGRDIINASHKLDLIYDKYNVIWLGKD